MYTSVSEEAKVRMAKKKDNLQQSPMIPEKIEQLAPEDLLAYGRNSRTHSDSQIKELAESIREYGFLVPVLIDDKNQLIAGHARTQAAKLAGLPVIPCIRATHLTPGQRRAYVIADNRLAEKAGWDKETLRLELGELHSLGYNLNLAGYNAKELKGLELNLDGVDEKKVPPSEEEGFVSRGGDVWLLGDHLLTCGDSADEEAEAKFCDSTVQRWQRLNGKAAILRATRMCFEEVANERGVTLGG